MKKCRKCGSDRVVPCTSDDYPDAEMITCLSCDMIRIKTEPDGEYLPPDDARKCSVCGLYYDCNDFQQVPWGNPGEEACTDCATGVGAGK